jgi:hypothetical protein
MPYEPATFDMLQVLELAMAVSVFQAPKYEKISVIPAILIHNFIQRAIEWIPLICIFSPFTY